MSAVGRNLITRCDNPVRAIRDLYRGVNGFHVPAEDFRELGPGRLSHTYGELTPGGARKLLDYLQLSERDVFYDLGAGVGKVVLQAALSVPLNKCVGIELLPSRCAAGRAVLREARRRGLIQAARCALRRGDFLTANLNDATAVYTCSTVFSARLLGCLARKVAALPRRPVLVSLRSLPAVPRAMRQVAMLRLPTTWNPRARAYVYRFAADG